MHTNFEILVLTFASRPRALGYSKKKKIPLGSIYLLKKFFFVKYASFLINGVLNRHKFSHKKTITKWTCKKEWNLIPLKVDCVGCSHFWLAGSDISFSNSGSSSRTRGTSCSHRGCTLWLQYNQQVRERPWHGQWTRFICDPKAVVSLFLLHVLGTLNRDKDEADGRGRERDINVYTNTT